MLRRMHNGGWLVIAKATSIPSMRVTRTIKRLTHYKAGHAGTLDPMASGLLPIALGRTTCLIPFLMHKSKDYKFTIRWGEHTDTGDACGTILDEFTTASRPTYDEILSVLPQFRGVITQIPPTVSAIKINGQRAYARARKGELFIPPERSVTIERLCLDDIISPDEASFSVTCTSGTYVRSLGQDIARALGTCGHLSSLCRTRVGNFSLNDARGLDFFEEIGDKWSEVIFPPEIVLDDILAIELSRDERDRIWRGQEVLTEYSGVEQNVACYFLGELVAIAQVRDGKILPKRCFTSPER